MAHVTILYGGRSGEHEVSRVSAAAVLANLDTKHEVSLIGIDREGAWYLQDVPVDIPRSLDVSAEPGRRVAVLPGDGLMLAGGSPLPTDVVLPILHGSFGEDGTVQGLLETARTPYAGSGVLGSAVGMDKDMAKRLWKQEGLPVVPWHCFREGDDPIRDAAAIFDELGSPVFVKPANAGSSVGVNRVDTAEGLEDALRTAWRHDRKVLVEKTVFGREIECSVMGDKDPVAYPPGEVIPAGGHAFYDYDAKYVDPDGALLKVPADLEDDLSERIRGIAVRAYASVSASGLARVDFLVKDGGEVFLNEINTMPGMTSISLFPRMAAAGGVAFTEMLERLIVDALDRAARRERLSYEK